MWIFRLGDWHLIELPECVDPSWTVGQRQKAAAIVWAEMRHGASLEAAWHVAERAIYEASSGIPRKQHGTPENEEK